MKYKGTFGVTGRVNLGKKVVPRIHVEGVGRLSWPIQGNQIELLKKNMEKAPFGKGSELVYDESVRKALQIDSSKITVDNSFDPLVRKVATQLGLDKQVNVEARLHKLVLYEEGGTFDWHQDTEKSNEMFGSLVINLPSYYEGGDFLIKHENLLVKSAYNQQVGEDGFFYSGFYSDCYHKVNTVTKGHRFSLLFDLVMKNTKPFSIGHVNANTKTKAILEEFVTSLREEDSSYKESFVFPLKHTYSDANRSLLKGLDGEKLSLLQNMKDENGHDLFFFALGYGTRKTHDIGDDRYDDDNIKITTYLPHSLLNEPPIIDFKLTEDQAEDLFSSPYKTETEPYQGNDPGYVDHWYKESFVLFWLSDHYFPIISEYYDIKDDICKLVKNHPAYGNKYLDILIKNKGNDIHEVVAASTLLLQDKERFLKAIVGEPSADTTKPLCKTISDAVETQLVTWDEVIPRIPHFKERFVLLIPQIQNDIKLKFLNEIKKSSSEKPCGFQSWINEPNPSVVYLFENFISKDKSLNIEYFFLTIYILQIAPEYGKYFTTRFPSLYCTNTGKNFYEKIMINFIKLNNPEWLRNTS